MKELMKKNKKGFTLVELLVVIAILAVLATVSVVGYTAFISKANNSNALTELKQAEELVLSDMISESSDTYVEVDGVYFFYESGNGRIEMIAKDGFSGPVAGEPKDITNSFTGKNGGTQKFHDTNQLNGKFEAEIIKTDTNKISEDTLKELKLITDTTAAEDKNYYHVKITYTTENGKGQAEWVSGEMPKAVAADSE